MNDKSIRNILVIRFRRVGDVVLSTVLCTTLKRSFPEAQIHYVLNEAIAPLLERHPDIDKLLTFNDKELHNTCLYVTKVRKIMKEVHYDMIVDARTTFKTLLFALFSLSTPFRLGKKKAYNFLHNLQTNNEAYRFPDQDETALNLALLKPLEKKFNIFYHKNFQLYVTEQEKAAYRAYMTGQGIDFHQPIVFCVVTTRCKTKRWNMGSMESILLKMMDKYHDVQWIFNYTGDEKEEAMELYHRLGKPQNIYVNIEAKGLRDLMALLSNMDFYFGNEGGARHIAQALGIPNFSIYLSHVPKTEWLPNQDEHNQGIEPADLCESEKFSRLTTEEKNTLLTADEVWKKLYPMLNKYVYENRKSTS